MKERVLAREYKIPMIVNVDDVMGRDRWREDG